jgi:hypothetical protein
VTGDQVGRFLLQVEDLPEAVGNETMRRPVEPVTPDLMPPVEQVGESVKICGRWHGLVKCRVEHRHLRNFRQQLLANLVPLQIMGIVQRRQFNAVTNLFNRPPRSSVRAAEFLAAVHHAMPDDTDVVPVP